MYNKGGFNLGGGNMQNLLKQAQKMQQKMAMQNEKAEEELANATLTATSGGGMVTVEMNGKAELKTLKINPEVVDADDVEMLEDLVIAAVNEATDKARKLEKELKPDMLGGM